MCDLSGKEIDTAQTRKILHQLALIQREKSPDKICLIQAAALMDAALVRNQTEVISDLRELHSHVLQLAGSARLECNLKKISEKVHEDVSEMRLYTKRALDSVNDECHEGCDEATEQAKINFMKQLQNAITNKYSSIMRSIAENCQHLLGPARCKFALVGMGSLARKEITPYSDFECVIVLEEGVQNRADYHEIREYFRWFAVIFQLILIGFGETIIPAVAVPVLNDFDQIGGDWFCDIHTPRGICFDGFMPHACKTPLGRQRGTKAKPWTLELIQPVSEMVHFLDVRSDIKNGYHLSDILTLNHFVAGDQSVYDDFHLQVLEHVSNIHPDEAEIILNQLQEDLETFSVFNNLPSIHSTKKINTKRAIYRSTTIFLASLGRLHGLAQSSSFDIVDELACMNVITSGAAHNLKYAVAFACEVRLKVYMSKGGQYETAENSPFSNESEVVKLAGLPPLIKYFKTAFCLQQMIRETPEQKKHVSNLADVQLDVETQIYYYFHQYEKAIECCKALRETCKKDKGQQERMLECTSVIVECLFRVERYDDALRECQSELDCRLKVSSSDQSAIANTRRALGRCFCKLERFDEAFSEHKKELAILRSLQENERLAACLKNIGTCLFKMKRYDEAIDVFQQSQNVQDKHSFPPIKQSFESITNIAGCYFKLSRYHDALLQYRAAKRMVSDNDLETKAICENNIAHCLFKLSMFDEALPAYQRELSIISKSGKPTDQRVKDCCANIASCFMYLNNFEQAFGWYRRIEQDGDKNVDENAVDHLHNIAFCLFQMEKFDDALEYYSKHLVHVVPENGLRKCAACLQGRATTLRKIGRIDEAVTTLEELLALEEQRTVDPNPRKAKCLCQLGNCFVEKNDYETAQEHFEQELAERKKIHQSDSGATTVADCMQNIASCLYKRGKSETAMMYLKQLNVIRKCSISDDFLVPYR